MSRILPLGEYTHTSIIGGQAVERVVSLGLSTDKARERIGGEGTGVATVCVNITNVDLDRGVVLGANEAVGCRAGAMSERRRAAVRQAR